MVDIRKALITVNPDILIEFRQSYTGPAMRKYGNMFRAGDCPGAAIINRVRTTDIKLLAGTTAVHSDMLMWNVQEPVHLAALQLLNVLFSVPQLSVKIDDLPRSHLNMVKFYTRYWLNNKDILLNGKFRAFGPELNYPLLMSVKNHKVIAGLYADILVRVKEKFTGLDIINAKSSGNVLLQMAFDMNCRVVVFDCMGKIVSKHSVQLKKGTNSLQVPPSGMIIIRR
jgi:alpha-galactosidase